MSFDGFHLKVIEGRNVESGHSYVLVKTTFNSQSFKSKVDKTKGTPKWDQEFKIITSKPEGEVHIKLFDKGLIRSSLIGSAVLDLKNYSDGESKEEWITLTDEKKKKDSPPEIHLQCRLAVPPGQKHDSAKGGEKTEKSDSKKRNQRFRSC